MKELTMNKKKRHILLIAIIAILVVFAGMLVGCGEQNTNETISENEVEPTSTPEISEEEPTLEPETTTEPTDVPETSEEPEVTSEPTSEPTVAPTTKPEPTEKPSEPTPAPVAPTEPPHTHNYISSVTNATCTTDGYTTYTCNCGDSYTTTIPATGHSYVNGDCHCGAHDPNYVPPHTHSWTEHTWTEDVVSGYMVEYIVCNGCGASFDSVASVHAHQDSTGWDGTPKHTGWCNDVRWIETVTQVVHHYRECSCGAREDID